MKQIFAIFFSLVFMLPIITSMYGFGNTVTIQMGEEIQEVSFPTKLMEEDKLCKEFHFTFPGCNETSENDSLNKNYVIQDDALIKCFHLDVLLRPPNLNYI